MNEGIQCCSRKGPAAPSLGKTVLKFLKQASRHSRTMHRRVTLLFPGQGAQRVGMAASLWANTAGRLILEEVDDALQFSLSRLMREGPMETLTLTEHTQPAIFAHSVAAYHVLKAAAPELDARTSFVMGHSVGEYAALAVAGSLPIAAGARLLRERGACMQHGADAYAAQAAPGQQQCGMAALILTDAAKDQLLKCVEDATTLCSQQSVPCSVAAINSPQQLVLSGAQSSVDSVAAELKKRGWSRRAVKLPVSAPFHSSIMTSARKHMQPFIEAAALAPPRVPIITNLTASPCTAVADIKAALVGGITAPVRWHDALHAAIGGGASAFLSCGPGRAVIDFARDSLQSHAATAASPAVLAAVSEAQDVEAALKAVLS